jgi:hypothetical protein
MGSGRVASSTSFQRHRKDAFDVIQQKLVLDRTYRRYMKEPGKPRRLFLFRAFRHAKRTVPEGRLDNRPALQLQRRLLTISKSAPSRRAPGGPG